MSVTAEAPPAPELKDPVKNVQLPTSPMRGLPPINRTESVGFCQQKRVEWPAPKVIPGEFVFYRKANDELPAVVMGSVNKMFTLFVFFPHTGMKIVSSVAYYDHTGPSEENDPIAAYANFGTFRRTLAGKLMSGFLESFGDIPSLVAAQKANADEILALRKEVATLSSLVMDDPSELKKKK